jgi:hypothetical protein
MEHYLVSKEEKRCKETNVVANSKLGTLIINGKVE